MKQHKKLKFTFVIPDMSWLWDYKSQFSLGILYLSEALRRVNCEVNIYDTNINDIKDIPFSDVFCFSVVHPIYINCKELAKKIKEIYPQSLTIIGGPTSTLRPSMIDKIFDVKFIGQSENTIRKFVEDLRNNKYESTYIENKPVDINEMLPYREFLSDEYIRTNSIFSHNEKFSEGGSTSIMFSRGCPFNCTFCCSVNLYKRRVNFRSIDSIKKEIEYIIATYGIRQFRVQDDTFTINKTFFRKLAKMLEELNIYYRCSTRIDTLDEETVDLLYKSGCREVGLGIEVADNEVLKLLDKGITVEKAKEAISLLRKYPIFLRQFFMMGLPYDSYKTIQANIDFIEETKPDTATVCNFIPFPGSEIGDNIEKYNIKRVKDVTCMNIAQHLELTPNIIRNDITEKEHIAIMDVFYQYLVKKGYV